MPTESRRELDLLMVLSQPTFWVLGTELCPPEKQQTLLIAELSPSPRTIYFYSYMAISHGGLEYL